MRPQGHTIRVTDMPGHKWAITIAGIAGRPEFERIDALVTRTEDDRNPAPGRIDATTTLTLTGGAQLAGEFHRTRAS